MWHKFRICIWLILFLGCKNQKDYIGKSNTQQPNVSTQSLDDELAEPAICIFEDSDYTLIDFHTEFGDTISTKNISRRLSNLTTPVNRAIRRIIKRGDIFFKISETNRVITVGVLEDEGEYLGVYAYAVDRQTCEILGHVQLAAETAWEHGYRNMFSIFQDEKTLVRIDEAGSKNWGDYKQWKRGTTTTLISFEENGQIKLEEKQVSSK